MSVFRFSLVLGLLAFAVPSPAQDKEAGEWGLLNKYIELAVPLPGGERLSEESRFKANLKKLYHDDDAKEAVRLEVRPVKGLEDRIAAFVKGHILRIQLAGVTAVETDDFHTFLKTLTTPPPGLTAMEKTALESLQKGSAADKVPKKGWIVEVRGYTYHNKGADFIRDTLVENIAALENVADIDREMKESLQGRIGFVMVYQTQKVKEGIDEASFLKKSPLRALADEGKLGKGAKAVDKLALKIEEPKRGKEEPPTPRTDFSVIFFWRSPDAALDKKY